MTADGDLPELPEPDAYLADGAGDGVFFSATVEAYARLAVQQERERREYVWCGCGDGIMPDTGALCGTCAAIAAIRSIKDDSQEEERKT